MEGEASSSCFSEIARTRGVRVYMFYSLIRFEERVVFPFTARARPFSSGVAMRFPRTPAYIYMRVVFCGRIMPP